MVAKVDWSSKCNATIADCTGYMGLLSDIYANNEMDRGNVFNELILFVLSFKLHSRASSWMMGLRQ
ncbi:hypothetical protein PM3016_3697 [Paenibacillus mucilaginosus 3016]|uniref:Uncharacterized protein n=2 Tax=Paenibacillus mucilaginosus TaxID=61624 RepID=H6NAP0_9BACL|nr:hypothetical protein PM3016_3697 [Paenibacillus mucilaginosus 3016]